jgi:hypothetical protein
MWWSTRTWPSWRRLASNWGSEPSFIMSFIQLAFVVHKAGPSTHFHPCSRSHGPLDASPCQLRVLRLGARPPRTVVVEVLLSSGEPVQILICSSPWQPCRSRRRRGTNRRVLPRRLTSDVTRSATRRRQPTMIRTTKISSVFFSSFLHLLARSYKDAS